MSEIDEVMVTEKVGALFEKHGVRLIPNDYWLMHESGHAVAVDASMDQTFEARLSVRLDIDLSLPDGRLITESFAGVGDDVASALDDAVDNFEENSLHVFLTAFFARPPSDMVTVETWKIDGVSWRIVASNFGCRQSKIDLLKEMPAQLFPEIETAIKCSKLRRNCHWFRLFFSQLNGKQHPIELLMDNDRWDAAKEPISRVPWKPAEGYYSVRSFVVAKRESRVDIPFLKEKTAIPKGLDMILNAWQKNSVGEADLYRQLTNADISPDLAERLLAFTPLGFSNVFLKGADLPVTYRLVQHGETGPEQLLDEEPVFVAARRQAENTAPELLRRHAMHCAMVDAVSKAVESLDDLTPERLRDFEFVAPAIFMPRFRPEPPAKKGWWKAIVHRVKGGVTAQ